MLIADRALLETGKTIFWGRLYRSLSTMVAETVAHSFSAAQTQSEPLVTLAWWRNEESRYAIPNMNCYQQSLRITLATLSARKGTAAPLEVLLEPNRETRLRGRRIITLRARL